MDRRWIFTLRTGAIAASVFLVLGYALDATQAQPVAGARGDAAAGTPAPLILAGPWVQDTCGDAATVTWITDKPCVSHVEYGSSETLGQKAQRVRHGLIDAGTRTHRIRLSGLAPGQPCYYRVSSREILTFLPYEVGFGESVHSEVVSFTPPSVDAPRVSVAVFNDTHGNKGTWKRLGELAGTVSFDFLVANGDMMNHIESHEGLVDSFLTPSSALLRGERPLVFVRGNHETRGSYARALPDYFALPHGSYYFAFTWGPVHFVVLDTGEDKPDGHQEYHGLVHFEPYLREEAEWLRHHVESEAFKAAPFRVVFSHIPLLKADDPYRGPVFDVLNDAGVDLAISGHTHRPAYVAPEPGARTFPVATGGGNAPEEAVMIHIEATSTEMTLRAVRTDGTVLYEQTYQPRA